jgi:hypothetical protein
MERPAFWGGNETKRNNYSRLDPGSGRAWKRTGELVTAVVIAGISAAGRLHSYIYVTCRRFARTGANAGLDRERREP